MEPTNPLSDQLANIAPVFIVGVVIALILVRMMLVKVKDRWARAVSETCDTINFVLILAFLLIRPFVAQAFYIPSGSMENTLQVNDRLIVDKFSYRFHEPQRKDVIVFAAPEGATDGQSDSDIDLIKRMIGAPGDTIQVKEARLIVNGEPIDPHTEGLRDTHAYLREKLGLLPDAMVKLYPDHVMIEGGHILSKADLAQLLGRSGAKITIVPGEVIRNGQPLDEPYTREDPDYNYPNDGSGQPLKLGKDELFMMGDNRNNSRDSHFWGPLHREKIVGHAVVLFWPPSRIGRIR